MNLQELYDIAKSEIANLHDYEDPRDITVLINLAERSVPSIAASGVKSIVMGFDWEAGQLRIEPECLLVKLGNNLNDEKLIKKLKSDGKISHWCPRCEHKISCEDHYCRHCGQKLRAAL